MPASETERNLQRLESELKHLEAEYNMFFAGRLKKPPWETRARVDVLVKQYDRAPIRNTGERFRFESLQSRYASLVELWDRGLRSREEGRGGPFGQARSEPRAEQKPAEPRVLCVSSFKDPMQEMDKLHTLYDSFVEARREVGEDSVPFHKFAELVIGQVKKLTSSGGGEVAFRVAVKDGKVNFTARPMKTDDD